MIRFLRAHKRLSFRSEIFLLLFGTFSIFLFILTSSVYFFDDKLLEEQYSYRAQEQARLIASMQPITQAVIADDREQLKVLIEDIKQHSDSSFISIADKSGIRLYHPKAQLIGAPISALKDHKILKDGEFYLSVSQGSMGMSVRGMEAILDSKRNIVGVVAVVYLIDKVSLLPYISFFIILLGVGIAVIGLISNLFARHIQKKMFYMEPEEIGLSYQIQQYVDNLRVIKHEYANKLATIGGLIELGEYTKVKEIIQLETKDRQEHIDFIRSNIFNEHIAGLLIGKCARAAELGCILRLDPSSLFLAGRMPLSDNELVAILGNLLDNAFEASLKRSDSSREVLVFLRNDGDELLFEVADSGIGISDAQLDEIFKKGITSKDEAGHGIGLYLVKQFVSKVEGNIIVDQNRPHGTIFSVFIPKT